MYDLYKNPIQYDTLNIVQFLHFVGYQTKPRHCIEINYPPIVTELPSIYDLDEQIWHIGYENVIKFYEKESGLKNLQQVADAFKEKFPNYRINNN